MAASRPLLTAAQVDALRDLSTVWPLDSFVLIGATALAFYYEMTWRQTEDVDLTVALPPGAVTADLSALGWRKDPRVPPRWFSRGNVKVDVIPADAAALARGTLDWGDGSVMNLTGFDLAFRHAERHAVAPNLAIRVAPPHVIAFLKIVAYLDRPADRERDLVDLVHLLDAYVADDSERRWTDAAGQDFDTAPAFLLGIDLGRILGATERRLVDSFVERDSIRAHLGALGPSHWRSDTDPAGHPLAAFTQGLAHTS